MNFIKLLNKNKEKEPKAYDKVYGLMVERRLEEEGYTSSKIQAIVNNYLSEPDNYKYLQEFKDLQECRKKCKAEVKASLEGG